MKCVSLLALTLSLTSAAIIPSPDAEPIKNNLEPRARGNRVGHPEYDPQEDPNYHRNGGDYGSGELLQMHREALARDRPPPEELRPRRVHFEPQRDEGADNDFSRQPNSANNRRQYNEENSYGAATAYRPSTHRSNSKREGQQKASRKVEATTRIPDLPFMGPFDLVLRAGIENKKTAGPKVSFITKGTLEGGPALPPVPISEVRGSTNVDAGIKISMGNFYTIIGAGKKVEINPKNPTPEPSPSPKVYETKRGERVYWDHGRLYRESDDSRINSQKVYNIPKRRRSSVLDDISGETTAPPNASSVDNLSADWQLYYAIWLELQHNATELIAPVINNLTADSNASCLYEMAWSIETQLTGAPNEVIGPYLYGLTNFDDYMDLWLLQHDFVLDTEGTVYLPDNVTLSNSTMYDAVYVIALNSWLQTTYTDTWNAAVQALNVTVPGSNYTMLENLVYFAAVITAPNRTDIIPPSFFQVQDWESHADASWFMGNLDFNGTATNGTATNGTATNGTAKRI